ncbi:MAG: SPOR domain-containing protein, partial [Prevotella sp.]|nr:SPOR domain-containing protein [Prevotella sp.]
MKQLFVLILLAAGMAQTGHAQTYLDHLQQRKAGEGTVTVTQSKAISDLVNGNRSQQPVKNAAKDRTTPAGQQAQNNQNRPPQAAGQQPDTTKRQAYQTKDAPTKKPDSTRHETVPPRQTENDTDDEMDIPTIDMRKKVMRKSYKVTGYRVQAYAGGNTRAARQKAESIRDNIKMKFPEEPIYVHF